MAAQYYYFIAGLPSISLDDSKLSLGPQDFRAEAEKHLSKEDYALIRILHLEEDILGFLKVLYRKEWPEPYEGLIPREFWLEYIDFLSKEEPEISPGNDKLFKKLPDFIEKAARAVLEPEELPAKELIEHQLLSDFYEYTAKIPNNFVQKWFELNRQIKNILAAINARQHQLDFGAYLIGDDPLTEQLQKSHATDFGLGKESPVFDAIYRIWEQNNILYRERGYDHFKAKWIDDQNFFEYFNIDRILGYYSKLRLIDRWIKADEKRGKELFTQTLDKLGKSFSFPEDFNIKITQK